jgi:hypothetical protein
MRAWQLLLAHSLHAAGSVLLALHADGAVVLPTAAAAAAVARPAVCSVAFPVLQSLAAAVAWSGAQLAALQQQAAGQAAEALIEQQQLLQAALKDVIAAARNIGNSSSSSSSSSSSLQDSISSLVIDGSKAMDLLVSLRCAVPAALAQQLVDFAAALGGRFPAKLACNAPGCSSLAKSSELEAVGGKSVLVRCAKLLGEAFSSSTSLFTAIWHTDKV